MSATCEKCSGTGMLPGSAYLDCASCDTAMIRVGLETWATENGIVADEDELWAIFKYGQSVALEDAVGACRKVAIDAPITISDSMYNHGIQNCIDDIHRLKQSTTRQTYWNNVAAGLVEVKTAAERAAEDRHHKPHAVYVEQEVAELRARLVAMSQKEVVAGQ